MQCEWLLLKLLMLVGIHNFPGIFLRAVELQKGISSSHWVFL